jgi:hypothetical protein
MTVKLIEMKTSLCFCVALLVSSVAFADVRVPSGDMKLEDGDLRISGTAKGIVFPDSSVQTTAAPAGLKTILNGSGDPLAGTGNDGDFYINIKTYTLFGPKASGAWPVTGVSLVGPTGATGATGAVGSQGSAGANYTLPRAPVLATGQQTTYAEGDDGNWKSGAVVSTTRFTDNLVNGVSNGTVTDNLTGLIWLKDAGCFATVGGITKGTTAATSNLTWANALAWSNSLASGNCGLTDGSAAGQWRLPNRKELMSLVDLSKYGPALPAGHPFSNVQSIGYWSGSTYSSNTTNAWFVYMVDGPVKFSSKTDLYYVWPVSAGQ